MDIQTVCKKTGYFCVGSAAWMGEMTAKGAVSAAKAMTKAAKAMSTKGEQVIAQQKAAAQKRRQQKLSQLPEEMVTEPAGT